MVSRVFCEVASVYYRFSRVFYVVYVVFLWLGCFVVSIVCCVVKMF